MKDKGTIYRKKNTMQRRGNPKKSVNMGMARRKKKKGLGIALHVTHYDIH